MMAIAALAEELTKSVSMFDEHLPAIDPVEDDVLTKSVSGITRVSNSSSIYFTTDTGITISSGSNWVDQGSVVSSDSGCGVTGTSVTTVNSEFGHGFVQDTTGTLSLGMDTQATLSSLASSLNGLNRRTGSIGTYYITVTGDQVNITLRHTGAGGTTDSNAAFWPKPLLKDLLSSVVKNNLLIRVNGRNSNMPVKWTPQEQKARDTLRDMISEKDWRRYVTNGFVMIRGTSGYWYQVFADHNRRIQVYKDNKLTHRICIHSDRSCPPSDHVINMIVMIEIDEQGLWQNGNVYAGGQSNFKIKDMQGRESILESYRRLKRNERNERNEISQTTNTLTVNSDGTLYVVGSDQLALSPGFLTSELNQLALAC